MRKLVAIVLALSMVLSFNLSLALAAEAPASVKNAASVAYTDVPSWHWASNVISTLSDRGVLGGYPDGSFRPDNMVTRSEFAKMIAIFMEIDITTTTVSSFSDVSSDHWALKYIEADKENDLVDGYPDGTFKPNDNIKRSEVSRIIVAANDTLNEKEKSSASMSTAATQFEPFSDIKGHWAENDILWLRDVGVADAYPDGLFRPDRLCSRAEAAKLLYLFLQEILGEQVTPEETEPVPGSSGGSDEPDEPEQKDCACEGDLDPNAIQKWEVGPNTVFNDGWAFLYVDDTSTPGVAGTSIRIPKGALDSFDDTITIGLSVSDDLPDGGAILESASPEDSPEQVSKVFKITKSTCCNFRLPIIVAIPFNTNQIIYTATSEEYNETEMPDKPSVFYWQNDSVNDKSRYVATRVDEPFRFMPRKNIDILKASTISSDLILQPMLVPFYTVHSGEFVALTIPGLADRMYGVNESTPTVDTGFRHNPNGFNTDSSEFEPIIWGLPSIGMANYAAWNYGFKPVNLYNRYSGSTRHELISRAFLASSNYRNEYLFDMQEDFFVGYQLIQTMKITGMPQTLIQEFYGYYKDAFLVSSCDVTTTADGIKYVFSVYDPGSNTTSTLDLLYEGSWSLGDDQYEDYMFDGISSSVEPCNYETLYDGAENGWPSGDASGFSRIELTMPTDNPSTIVDTETIHVKGKVAGGEYKAKYIVYNVNGLDGYWLDGAAIPLQSDGSFDFYITNLPYSYDDPNSIMFYAFCSECATINRCAAPPSAFKEIKVYVQYSKNMDK